MEESGKLIFGVRHGGQLHKDFIIRPELVSDTVKVMEAIESPGTAGDYYLGVCFLAERLVKLGDIPKEEITPDLILGMYRDDFDELVKAKGRLEKKMRVFRGEDKTDQTDTGSPAKDRPSL